jgi:cysteinyl-tRNA synthetase
MGLPITFSVFNTWTRSIEPIVPRAPGKIGIYCCGPTVYDYQHLGNFKTFLFEDVLVRALRFAGFEVTHVMNITDVGHLVGDGDEGEDKMILAMKRERKKSTEIAEYYTKVFFEDWDRLNLIRPTIVCKATEHIGDMIALIQRIEKNGFTYQAGGNVYFDTSKMPNYGYLARLKVDQLRSGARVEVDQNKRNPADFVLWFTKSKFENQELQWDSPWGRGYPGWHIECSAMSMRYLGEHFDIHCGGIDHIPVHHTNEIAQSEAAVSAPWVNVWMHSEFIMVNAEKMSKSKGKFLTLDDVIQRGIDPLAYRFLCLNSHYRSQLNFTWDILENARNAFERLRSSVLALKAQSPAAEGALTPAFGYLEKFRSAVCDDLNMPKAMSVVWEIVQSSDLPPAEKLATLYTLDQVLGLNMAAWSEASFKVPASVQALLSKRAEARKNKDWKGSDALRDEILKAGFIVMDGPDGQKLKKGNP